MSAATTTRIPRLSVVASQQPEAAMEVTLLDLVSAVSEECQTEAEVVATVLHLLSSGRARLGGNFRTATLRDLCQT